MTHDETHRTSRRFYRLLLRLYPAPFRRDHGAEMEAVFLASLRMRAKEGSRLRISAIWAHVLWDTMWHAVTLRRRTSHSEGLPASPLRHLRWATEDGRFAMRHMRRHAAFTGAAVATMALGVGLSTAVFATVYSLLLRPVPGVRAPDDLVQVYRSGGGGGEFLPSSLPLLRDLQEDSAVFSGVAGWALAPLGVSVGGQPERVVGQVVSADFFEILGVPMERGRSFGEADRGHRVAVVSHSFWVSRLGSDPEVVGETIEINGTSWAIVGVAPAQFRGPLQVLSPGLWVPLSMHPELMHIRDQSEERGNNFVDVVARLRPRLSLEGARQRVEAFTSRLQQQYPDYYGHATVRLVPEQDAGIHPAMRGAQVDLSMIMMSVVILFLVISVLNVTILFLAQAEGRWREVAVRRSLGAPRGRLFSEIAIEGVLLSLLAGTLGFALAGAIVRAVNAVPIPAEIPISLSLTLGRPAAQFATGAALFMIVIFGLTQVTRAWRPDILSTLRTRSDHRGMRRFGQTLVALQVGISTVVLMTAGLLAKNLLAATRVDVGFRSDDVFLATLDPRLSGYQPAEARRVIDDLTDRIEGLPGVRSLALATSVPLSAVGTQRTVSIPGYQPARGETMNVPVSMVGPAYFTTMGIAIERGRGLERPDRDTESEAVVVNRHFADRFWRGEDPMGRVVVVDGRARTVVGVVPTGKYRRLGEAPTAFLYLPLPASYDHTVTILVRTAGDPSGVAASLRQEVAAVAPGLPLYDLKTMKEHLGLALLPATVAALAMGCFGLACLVLLSVGLHAVIAYTVEQRRREIGIRVAVGANPRGATAQIFRDEIRTVLGALVVGVAVALLAAQSLRGVLYSTKTVDPSVLLGTTMLLVIVAALACLRPARRALLSDPMRSLLGE